MLTQNVIFRASSQQYVRAQSKNLYYSKQDVSTTVDMRSSRFSECGQLLYYYQTDSSYHQNDIFASTSVFLFMTYLSCWTKWSIYEKAPWEILISHLHYSSTIPALSLPFFRSLSMCSSNSLMRARHSLAVFLKSKSVGCSSPTLV